MTSFGAKQIVEDGFMPTFKMQGHIYHLHGSLPPDSDEKTQFLKIYFVCEDKKEATLRCSNYPGINQELVKLLQQMLHDVNKYIKTQSLATLIGVATTLHHPVKSLW